MIIRNNNIDKLIELLEKLNNKTLEKTIAEKDIVIEKLRHDLENYKNFDLLRVKLNKKLYDLFLDENRQYSCAYFKNDNDTLEQAQSNKIDHIIKKLNEKEIHNQFLEIINE